MGFFECLGRLGFIFLVGPLAKIFLQKRLHTKKPKRKKSMSMMRWAVNAAAFKQTGERGMTYSVSVPVSVLFRFACGLAGQQTDQQADRQTDKQQHTCEYT